MQGDELVEVINNFPDIHVNFTVFTMMPFNSTQPSGQFVRDTFNTTLAQDAVALLQKVLNDPFEKNTTSFIRKALVERIFSVSVSYFVFSESLYLKLSLKYHE